MIALLKHNLVAGWRNVMKYKVQNIISVFCLAVGAIFFAIALAFSNTLWEKWIKNYVYNDPVRFKLYEKPDYANDLFELSAGRFDTIAKLPSVKSVCYMQMTDYSALITNQWFDMGCQAAFVTPDWLEKNDFCSSITGKKIGLLRPGTVIATGQWRRTHVGTEPVGTKIRYLGCKENKVSDVVYSPSYVAELPSVCIVVPSANARKSGTSVKCLQSSSGVKIHSVEMNDGYTAKQFAEQIEKAIPEVKVELASEVKWERVIAYVMVILMGSIVLVIGMSGYLKMQLQLFCLRCREMALRRCNGAKPAQLFMLLCSELFIVFLFTAILAIVLSISLAYYAMPKIEEFGMQYEFGIYPPIIYQIVVWVVVAAFIVAVGIGWITVRKMLKNPLSVTVDHTFSQRTAWNKSMQVVQYVATTILLTVTGSIFYLMGNLTGYFDVAGNISDYKKIGVVYGVENSKEVTKLPCVEKHGWLYLSNFSIAKEDTAKLGLRMSGKAWKDENGLVYYNTLVCNAEIFKMFKLQTHKHQIDDPDLKQLPVYVKVNDATSVMRQLGLKYKPAGKTYMLRSGQKYILLGWASCTRLVLGDRNSNCFVIEDKMYDERGKEYGMFLLKLKNDDIQSFLQQSKEYSTKSLYDSNWCASLRMFEFGSSLMFILAIVAVMSIVLTIYSSVSLETRGKQKEVAIRKINGAKTRDIIMLFTRYYIVTLAITSVIVFFFSLILCAVVYHGNLFLRIFWSFMPCFLSIAVITAVTVLTLWQKVYRISHIKPALLIKKE